jgi:phage terminase large subunit
MTGSRYAAYIGGLGSGKTFAGNARGIAFSQQPTPPDTLFGPRGCCAAISYPVLKDVVVPSFFGVIEGTGLLLDYVKSEKKAIIRNGPDRGTAEILFRSLDNPNAIRGVELSWFFIDEAARTTREAFDILNGRLRQPGYAHAGWVCSTPNGYDWMWSVFSPDSPAHYLGAEIYEASTLSNAAHLPSEYIDSLEATYEGKWYEQEVLGHFVGLMAGGALPHWDPQRYLQPVPFDPSPDVTLHTFWDFGVGDLGVCEFAQLAWQEKRLASGAIEYVPVLKFVDVIEATDWGVKEWAAAYRAKLEELSSIAGRPVTPRSNFGDPAGQQRNTVTGTSIINALAAKNIVVRPAPKRSPDLGLLILDNMMAGGRVLVDSTNCPRVSAAFSTHRFAVDENGNRTANRPVHDWTSHFCDAARYGAVSLLSLFPRRSQPAEKDPPGPGTFGHMVGELDRSPKSWLGRTPVGA